ncbi:MAG: hypothetical protein Q4B70_18790 [Lachnospiraceae bacterium]|nr:hypothetical protein [Lachnospiraceae bacterium]
MAQEQVTAIYGRSSPDRVASEQGKKNGFGKESFEANKSSL